MRPFPNRHQIFFLGACLLTPALSLAQSAASDKTPAPTKLPAESWNDADEFVNAFEQQFLQLNEELEQSRLGTERVDAPGPVDRPNPFQILKATRDSNAVVDGTCRRKAVAFAPLVLQEKKGLTAKQARKMTFTHAHEMQDLLRDTVTYRDYLKHLAECDVCGPLVSYLLNCHVEAVSRHDKGILTFATNSDVVANRHRNEV
ncbi:MAG: hypothetical protein ACR2RB_07200, partial [Gammaproteobacteria bacterium]